MSLLKTQGCVYVTLFDRNVTFMKMTPVIDSNHVISLSIMIDYTVFVQLEAVILYVNN